MTRWCRCPQSSSCPQHTARSRSTSCFQRDRKNQPGTQNTQQQKSIPVRYCKFLQCTACKRGSIRCPPSSSCPQRTVLSQPMTRSPPGNTPPQGTPSTRSAPKTHSSHCTSLQDKQCKPHLSRCPPLSSCRARTVRCRSMSCSPPGNTPPKDTHCTRLWFRCLQPRSFRQRTRHFRWRWSNRLNSTCRPGKHCTTHFERCQQ